MIATVYIMINLALGYLANWLERRSRRSRKVAADPAAAEAAAGGEVALMR